MSIVTKTGDGGETSLYTGERVAKNSPIIKCLAKLDTFDSWLGIVYVNLNSNDNIRQIQKDLILIKGEVASSLGSFSLNKHKTKNKFTKSKITYLDNLCLDLEKDITDIHYPNTGWIMYGDEGELSALVDYARALCRECEVELVDLTIGTPFNKNMKKYLNRLSDYLFLLARKI